MKFSMTTRKTWPLNTGDCLIEVTTCAGLTYFVCIDILEQSAIYFIDFLGRILVSFIFVDLQKLIISLTF
jgi:hypothetical protein